MLPEDKVAVIREKFPNVHVIPYTHHDDLPKKFSFNS